MIVHRQADRLLILIVPVFIFIYFSTRATLVLQDEPPPEFLRMQSDWRPKRRVAEERMARAYWKRAVDEVQWRYTFGSNLPSDPPADFQISETGLSQPEDPGARVRYWQRLRQVWPLPDAWRKSYRWSTAWLTNALASVGDWFLRLWEHF
jgi:hypothetical protein